jgi:hypothetical protein
VQTRKDTYQALSSGYAQMTPSHPAHVVVKVRSMHALIMQYMRRLT